MFFDLDLLCRKRQGKFAFIWLAATRGVNLIQRKEINNIDISHTCAQLQEYIMSRSQSPKKRLSLYLSSKLIYGTVLIYRKQVINFQNQIFCFIQTIRRPLTVINPEILGENDLCDAPKKKRKPRTKGKIPSLQEQPVLEQNIDLGAQLANLNVTDAINITLRDEVPSTRPVEQELFGDEGQIDLQLLMLDPNTWDTITVAQSTTVPPTLAAATDLNKRRSSISETEHVSPSKRRRTDGLSLDTPITELTQEEQDRIIQELDMQVSPVLGRDKRFAQPPVDHTINIPSAAVQIPQIVDEVQPNTSILVARQADVVPANNDLAPPPRRKRVRLPRIQQPTNVDTPRKRNRDIKSNDVEQLIVNQDLGRSQLKSRFEDPRDIIATLLASVNYTEEDLISIARDIREKDNISIESGPRDITTVANLQKQILPSVVEQVEANLVHTEIAQVPKTVYDDVASPRLSRIPALDDENLVQSTIINEPMPISPRVHTSTPLPYDIELRRHANLLTLIRGLFKENSSVTIDQLCFPPTRFNVARTFHGLLHLEAKQYIYMEALPNSTELSVIKPGARI